MAVGFIDEETYAKWTTPALACDLLVKTIGDQRPFVARRTLLNALGAGVLVGVAQISSWPSTGKKVYLQIIPAEHWSRVEINDNLWRTGHTTYSYWDVQAGSVYSGRTDVARFGVRFDPAGVGKLLPPTAAGLIAAIEAPEPAEDLKSKGPAVSEADLKVWFDAYQQTYGGTAADTLPNAWKSAQGMFHDKSVTRARVRALFEARKPGRKTSDDPAE